IEQNGFIVSVRFRFPLRENGIHVVAGNLSSSHRDIEMMASKRRYAGPHPIRERIIPEVGAPSPGRDGQLNWVIAWIDPHRSMPDVDEGADIAGFQLIHSDGFHDGRCDLLL